MKKLPYESRFIIKMMGKSKLNLKIKIKLGSYKN